MKSLLVILGLVAWCAATGQTVDERVPPSQLAFVQEFVREMQELENLRADGEKDLSHVRSGNEQILLFVHWATSVQVASRTDVEMLKDVKLSGDSKDTPALLSKVHQERIELLEHMKDLGKQILKGPQPGVDYSQIMTDMTESRAVLERLNSTLVNPMSGLVFLSLLDIEHPDSRNHVSYLVITKKEKRELVKSLAFTTGAPATNSPFQNAGGVIYDGLLKKGFKCADERQL